MTDFNESDFRNAVQELYFWQRTDATNFTAKLYSLFSKADPLNTARLAGAFPFEYAAFRAWQDSPNEEAFFNEWLKDD